MMSVISTMGFIMPLEMSSKTTLTAYRAENK